MAIAIVFETHSMTEDNERGIATGWEPSRLSGPGREQAVQLGERRKADGLTAVYSSDLERAVETAVLAISRNGVPLAKDQRLRECHFGSWAGKSRAHIDSTRTAFIDKRYPEGESWREAVGRVGGFLQDLKAFSDNSRILVIGHMATWISFEHLLNKRDLRELLERGRDWQPGWEYTLL